MITGLQFDVRSDELKDMLLKQVDINTKRSEDAESYAERISATPSTETVQTAASATAAQNIARARARSFEWLSKHVVPSENYRLSLSELVQAGLVQGFSPEQLSPHMFTPRSIETRANA